MIEEKYIKLLVMRCLKLDINKSLFIDYDIINKDFVQKLVDYANSMGIKDIYLHENDVVKEHNFLLNNDINDIKNCSLFDNSIWDEYAKKDAAFLMLEAYFPGLMDDVSSDKIGLVSKIRRETKPIYKQKQLESIIPWCIAALPNSTWAEDLFQDAENPLQEFWNVLAKICFLDKDDPICEWDKLLKYQNDKTNYLNSLNIKKLYYKNDLGTNLEITLPENALWQSASSGEWIVNLPSYEIFSTPDYHKTNGIVYSSKPLIYNGKIINDFYLRFKDGKVVEYNAKEGKKILKEIIDSDEYSSYLGECALVNYNSPISNTNKVFKTTLLDENASCHLALGAGFLECVKGSDKLTDEELKKVGINPSKNHVDFMIGTKDLEIEAECDKGRITIMKNGNLVI